MSVTHELDPGCSALGHLYRPEGDHKVCITCGHLEYPAGATPESSTNDE